ncbi:MAG: hypothetical protein ACI93R_003258 [Flavobacteriales bacterium]|jgi:hypothetical protein
MFGNAWQLEYKLLLLRAFFEYGGTILFVNKQIRSMTKNGRALTHHKRRNWLTYKNFLLLLQVGAVRKVPLVSMYRFLISVRLNNSLRAYELGHKELGDRR